MTLTNRQAELLESLAWKFRAQENQLYLAMAMATDCDLEVVLSVRMHTYAYSHGRAESERSWTIRVFDKDGSLVASSLGSFENLPQAIIKCIKDATKNTD